ncbi:hypothetical protein P7C71_g3224, partial [Lecanoromycetidae sp. Uapishka_2]
MVSHLINTLALLATALSHPTSYPDILPRQTFGGAGDCDNEWVISSVTSDTTSWSPVTVADGLSCTSDALEECTVGETYTKSFSLTVEAGVDIDFGEVFGMDSSVSYTWTTATGYSVGEPCPPGGYVCGLTYTNNVANVAGIQNNVMVGDCVSNGDIVGSQPYSFTAPVTVGPDAQVTFAACISAASPNQTAVEGTPSCPGGF